MPNADNTKHTPQHCTHKSLAVLTFIYYWRGPADMSRRDHFKISTIDNSMRGYRSYFDHAHTRTHSFPLSSRFCHSLWPILIESFINRFVLNFESSQMNVLSLETSR